MKLFLTLLFWTISLYANIYDIPLEVKIDGDFAKNKDCVRCHLTIYKEFKRSKHYHSHLLSNEIHKAMYNNNPLSKNSEYICAECHAPATKDIEKVMQGTLAFDGKDTTHKEGISCAYCHRISDLTQDGNKYHNKLSDEKTKYFGNRSNKSKSEFHKIVTGNEKFKNGDSCLACHSGHSRNKMLVLKESDQTEAYCVYSTLENPNQDSVNSGKDNCISCHMPQVKGSISDRVDTTTHAYHGFAGLSTGKEHLEKYVTLSVVDNQDSFEVSITNKAAHDLVVHPIRGLYLEVEILKDQKQIRSFETIEFKKESANIDAMPLEWLKDRIVYTNTIQSNQTKKISFPYKLQNSDTVHAKLYYKQMRDEIAQKVGIGDIPNNIVIIKEIYEKK
jgi:nitrate reductase cytochrome c-type subunit